MKYVKANECLPEQLLQEIQKYVCGEFIYIPAPVGSRKRWGENSGIRRELQLRRFENISEKAHRLISYRNNIAYP